MPPRQLLRDRQELTTSVAGVAQCDGPFSLALRCYDRFPVPAQQEQALLIAVGTIARLQVDRATSDALLAVLFLTSQSCSRYCSNN